MQNLVFLTDLDSRAAVKGSRDPLGVQPIWTRFGRRVIGNLTTVSNSVRDFKTLLIGCYYAAELVDICGPGSESNTFLKFEQLAAYSRVKFNSDRTIRGIERVRKVLDEGSTVTLSEQREHQILGNQRTYGIWGLYTMCARASGFIDGDPPRLTPEAAHFVESCYLPALQSQTVGGSRALFDILAKKSRTIDLNQREVKLGNAVAGFYKPRVSARERTFFEDHLLFGGPSDSTKGKQRQLADLVLSQIAAKDVTWSPATLSELVKAAHAKGKDCHPLAERLDRIRTCESVLAPALVLFNYLLGLDSKTLLEAASLVRHQWVNGVRSIDPARVDEIATEMGGDDADEQSRWSELSKRLTTGDYESVIELLLKQNKSVMLKRGGAPWIEKRDGKLFVSFQDERGRLPERDEISSLWRNPYFLDSLRSVAVEIGVRN